MNSPLMVAVLGLALVMTTAVHAYDPVPDPRMSPNPPTAGSTKHGSEDRNADSGGYDARSNERNRRLGEPEFGSKPRRGGGYDSVSGGHWGN